MGRRARSARDLIKDRASIHDMSGQTTWDNRSESVTGRAISSCLTLVAQLTGETDAETISAMRDLLRSIRAMAT